MVPEEPSQHGLEMPILKSARNLRRFESRKADVPADPFDELYTQVSHATVREPTLAVICQIGTHIYIQSRKGRSLTSLDPLPTIYIRRFSDLQD